MSFDEIKNLVDDLKTQGEMCFFPASKEENISTFEENNNITLPTKLKEWLLFSDGGELYLPAGVQLYGVSNKPIIDVNDNDRPNDDYIVIGTLSTGDPILCERNCERISIYNREAGKIEDDESFNDFFDFLSNLGDVLGIGG